MKNLENFSPKETPINLLVKKIQEAWGSPSAEKKEIFEEGDRKEKKILEKAQESDWKVLIEASRTLGLRLKESV